MKIKLPRTNKELDKLCKILKCNYEYIKWNLFLRGTNFTKQGEIIL